MLAITLLISCATTDQPATAPATRPTSLRERVESMYPQRIASFARTEVKQYDEGGDDVSVGYSHFDEQTRETDIAVTVYFLPLPPAPDAALDRYFGQCVGEVERAHPDSKRVTERAKIIRLRKNGRDYDGRLVEFTFAEDFGGLGKRQELISELWVFDDSPRAVKYRISYPKDRANAARARLAEFYQHFPWPEK